MKYSNKGSPAIDNPYKNVKDVLKSNEDENRALQAIAIKFEELNSILFKVNE